MNSYRDIIFIDNFDSFTYNLVEEFSAMGCAPVIYRNTTSVDVLGECIAQANNPLLVLSPGPGAPEQAGLLMDYLSAFLGRVAILGICLGHQALVLASGGSVERAQIAVHGQRSLLTHEQDPIFAGLPGQFMVGRYHSLVATQLPTHLMAIAHSENLIMAVRHCQYAALGFQFHPESILTTHGRTILRNVLVHLQQGDKHARAA